MNYFGAPRWRYLLVPFALLSIFPGGLVALLSFGTVRGVQMANDFLDWATYADE